jgi:hypothetical protein
MTRKHISMFSVLLGLILVTGAAQAVTLITPPLVPLGKNQLDCYLINVSNEVREATIEVLNRKGEALRSAPVTLEPGAEDVVRVDADELPRYCKFIVDGERVDFRASILVEKPGVGSISALPAE